MNKDDAARALRAEGVDVEVELRFTTLSEMFDAAERASQGDLWGLEWAAVVSGSENLPEALTRARKAAQADKVDKWAAVVADGLVVMPLEVWAKVLKAEQEAGA